MANCSDYISADDLKTGKQAVQHIEHVAKSKDANGAHALTVTDTIRGEQVTNLTLDGMETQFQTAQDERETEFEESQADKEERFQQFLLNSGYQFIGDYVNGPYTITTRNQIVRYQNEFWRLNAATNPPYTTTGINSTSWAVDVTHLVSVGDATLRQDLASSIGTSLVYGGHAPISIIIPASIFQFMTAADLTTIQNSLAAEVVVDYALLAAINAGVTHLTCPPALGRYVFSGTVTVPTGFNFVGSSSRPYTISGDTSFNNRGTVFKLAAGAPGLFVLTGRHTFTGIIFDGRDNSVGMVYAASQIAGLRFEQCGSYRWTRGFGRSSGYLGTLYARGCNASSNVNAFYNLIDSKVMDTVANANSSHAVNLQSGANNNAFIGLRVEWNDGYGLLANGAVGNIYEGEMIDRNGLAGVCCLSGGVWLIGNAVVRRNGRLAGVGNSDNCHFRVEGSGSSLQYVNVRTSAGADDDGGGTITPEYALITTGSSTNLTLIGADSLMTGYTIASTNYIVTPANRNFKNNNGINDTVTTGLSQHTNGRSYMGPNPGSISLSIAGTASYVHTHQSLTTFSNPVRAVLDITARNTTLVTPEYFRCILLISRVGSGAAIVSVTPVAQGNSANWGLSGSSPTGVSVTVSISADAATLTINLQGIDSSARVISSQLKDL